MSNKEYSQSSIRVLEGLEPVRVRPGMYIGSTDERGLHHLVYEVVDNSIDEAMAGRCDTIEVTLGKDGSCTVRDNGSGIPVDKHRQTGKSTLETVLTILHAGGKFDSDTYEYSGGLHGVGVSVVNALSKRLEARVVRDGYLYEQFFEYGKTVSELKKVKKANGHGTEIKFYPDDTIFETVEFSKKTLQTRFREMAFLNAGIKIIFFDERDNFEETFYFEGGIKEFVKYLNKNKDVIQKNPAHFTGEREDIVVDFSFQYTTSYSENILSFANNILTPEGGTHLTGFKSAFTRVINDYSKNNGFIKEKDETLTGEDIRGGITAIVTVKVKNPQFEGQTKAKLGNSEVRGAVESFVAEKLDEFLEENPKLAKEIVKQSIVALRARLAARKAKDIVRKRSILDNTTLPGKLADCQETDISVNEIFLVEGDSAGGSAKNGRDNRIQAILPLKGKIMNVEKARLEKILDYEEIKAMITAFGTGIGDEFNIEKLRYGKIIIMTDADVDGAHIRTLLLTFFYRYMRPLIENGHIYIAQPPLYKISQGKKERYVYDDKELKVILSELDKNSYKISRYKGLGEMNYDQLWDTTMDPDRRILLKVNIDPESITVDETFNILMGDKVEPRREFIEENAKYTKNIDA